MRILRKKQEIIWIKLLIQIFFIAAEGALLVWIYPDSQEQDDRYK